MKLLVITSAIFSYLYNPFIGASYQSQIASFGDNPKNGACGFNNDLYNASIAQIHYVAIGNDYWEEGMNCGRCIAMKCIGQICNNSIRTTAIITDICPECRRNHDLSNSSFYEATGVLYSRRTITWDFVPCPSEYIDDGIIVYRDNSENPFFVPFQPRKFKTKIVSMEIIQKGKITVLVPPGKHSVYGFFFLYNSSEPLVGPFSLRIIGENALTLEKKFDKLWDPDTSIEWHAQMAEVVDTTVLPEDPTSSATTSMTFPTITSDLSTSVTPYPSESPNISTTVPCTSINPTTMSTSEKIPTNPDQAQSTPTVSDVSSYIDSKASESPTTTPVFTDAPLLDKVTSTKVPNTNDSIATTTVSSVSQNSDTNVTAVLSTPSNTSFAEFSTEEMPQLIPLYGTGCDGDDMKCGDYNGYPLRCTSYGMCICVSEHCYGPFNRTHVGQYYQCSEDITCMGHGQGCGLSNQKCNLIQQKLHCFPQYPIDGVVYYAQCLTRNECEMQKYTFNCDEPYL